MFYLLKKNKKNRLKNYFSSFIVFTIKNLIFKYDLVRLVQRSVEDNKFFLPDIKEISNILKDEKINYIDVGASVGLERKIKKYQNVLNIIQIEPEKNEAAKLLQKNEGKVIDKLIGHNEENTKLNVTRAVGCSSILEPNFEWIDYHQPNDRRWDVIKSVDIEQTTLKKICEENGLQIDFLKLDVQGYEDRIIKGLGSMRPLIISTEISFVPLYKDSAIIFDLGKQLYDMGYIMFHQAYRSRSSPDKQLLYNPYSEVGIPLHGDAWFMPRWTSIAGEEIIKGRELKYQALMKIFGMESISKYALKSINRKL